MSDVFAGGTEDLAVDVDRASMPTGSPLLSNGSGDGVSPRITDALVQVEVADRMRHDG